VQRCCPPPIAALSQKEMMYQTKYGMNYLTFTRRIAEGEEFISQVG